MSVLSDRFLNSFANIEQFLQKTINRNRHYGFAEMVDIAARENKIVRQFRDDLKEFAELRNAMIHNRGGNYVIADPNELAVNVIERIEQMLLEPPKIFPLFECKAVTLTPHDSLSSAIRLMSNRTYSQIPIYEGRKFVGLLTGDGIVHWLGSNLSQDVFSMRETKISTVLQYAGDKEDYLFMSKHTTIFDALAKFREYERKGKRLEAILITHQGNPMEPLLGLMTIWDVYRAYQAIELPHNGHVGKHEEEHHR